MLNYTILLLFTMSVDNNKTYSANNTEKHREKHQDIN